MPPILSTTLSSASSSISTPSSGSPIPSPPSSCSSSPIGGFLSNVSRSSLSTPHRPSSASISVSSPSALHPHPHPRKVLLLIAPQVAMLSDPPQGVPNSYNVRKNIERILAAARDAPDPPLVIHVRNNGYDGDADQPGSPGWQLALVPRPNEPVIDKRKNNAFTNTRLSELIPSTADLVVVGMQSDFCIRATCSAALHRGNNVFLVEGAHATFDRPEAYAADGAVLVTPALKVEQEIESELEEAGVLVVKMEDLDHLFTDS